MRENESPTSQSTSPLGNSEPQSTPLARDISPHVKEKLKDHPEQRARIHKHLARKRTESGHACD